MATATKIQLVEFNKDEALNGASLAFSSNGQLSGAVSDYVLNFQLNDIGSVTEKYSGQVQKKCIISMMMVYVLMVMNSIICLL
jgi:hypothetical protein